MIPKWWLNNRNMCFIIFKWILRGRAPKNDWTKNNNNKSIVCIHIYNSMNKWHILIVILYFFFSGEITLPSDPLRLDNLEGYQFIWHVCMVHLMQWILRRTYVFFLLLFNNMKMFGWDTQTRAGVDGAVWGILWNIYTALNYH